MDKLDKKQSCDLVIRKIFDIKMKQGHEMRKAFVDESEFLRTLYFLKGLRVYIVDTSSKKFEELEFTKGKEVVFLTGNMNNEQLMVVMKNGNIYAIDNNHNVKHIKNLLINSLFYDNKKKENMNFENFKLFASDNLNKIVIANDTLMAIWYQNEFNQKDYSAMLKLKKSTIEELNGTFYNISLENEKKIFIKDLVPSGNTISIGKDSSRGDRHERELSNNFTNKNSYFENLTAYFGENYYLGSYGRILYFLLIPTEIPNSYKIVLIDYLFRYDTYSKPRVSDLSSCEYIKNIEKKIVYAIINYSTELAKENLPLFVNKERTIMKYNNSGNICAIMLNCQYACNSTLIFLMTETYKVNTCKVFDFYSKVKPHNDDNRLLIWVEDIEWICNDLFLVMCFSQGYFCILNINFQLVSFIDSSNSLNTTSVGLFQCPNFFLNPKLKHSDKLQLISSKKRTDYFLMHSVNFIICYQINYKNFESRLLVSNPQESFDEFLYILKYFQLYYQDTENSGLFDKIHNYMVNCMKELYHTENDVTLPNENLNHIFSIFIKFIRIFRSINQIHETNLTILTYLIGISNDFFYYLINYKDIWLAFLFINICENYLLKHFRLKVSRNKLDDEQMSKCQSSYLALNPYYQHNMALKCYNKINNKIMHSRLRLILIFFALIEFRNNQALNINVLYFILGKLCIDKLKKHSMLDDVQLIVKAVIRNYKYLKSENSRAGSEEYILNGLTMNHRTEILSHLIHNRVSREDIKFDFFADFYGLDDLQNFTELNEIYCRGDEESLVNEYNYINHVGVVQKWILFFTNFFYAYLFDDIKNYISNHLRQGVNMNKSAENISPEEKNLSSLIYFNTTMFFLSLINHLKYFIHVLSAKSENSSDLSFLADDQKILYNFNKILLPFISPVDIPFLIFEFYVNEDNKMKKDHPFEININLNNLVLHYFKFLNFTMNDTFDFVEFLMNNGFRSYAEINEESNQNYNYETNKFQKFIFSAFTFYIFSLHKLSQLHFLDIDNDMIMNVIDNMESSLKAEFYDFIFLILNGHLRFYLKKEALGKLSANHTKYLEIVLTFIKVLFYKIVREDPPFIRKNIHEVVYIAPSVMKPYLTEGALYYEYKNFNKTYKTKLLDCKNLLDLNNFILIPNNNKKNLNIFEELTKENRHQVFDILQYLHSEENFNQGDIDDFTIYYKNFIYSVKNLIMLTKVINYGQSEKLDKNDRANLLFAIESNKEYIRKLILSTLSEKSKERDIDDKYIYDIIVNLIDKVIKGNFENKSQFKFSNLELKTKLVKSIKLVIAKSMHLFNILFIKFKAFSLINPSKEVLVYLKYLSFCLIYEKQNKEALNQSLKIFDFLLYFNYKDCKSESDKNCIVEIIRNLYTLFMKLKKNLTAYPKMNNIEEKIKLENKDIWSRLKTVYEDIGRIKMVNEILNSLRSNNLRMFLISLYSDFYLDNLYVLYSHLELYVANQNYKGSMRLARKKYIKYSESFTTLTGIPSKSFIDFQNNWELTENETLFNFIINDEFEDINSLNNSLRDDKDSKQNLIMNRRQRFGSDTPRKKSPNLNLKNYKNEFEKERENFREKEREISIQDDNVSINSYRLDTNQSIDMREEQDEPKNRHITNNLMIKIKTNKKRKANLPKYGTNSNKKYNDTFNEPKIDRADSLSKNLDSGRKDTESIVTVIKQDDDEEIKIEDYDEKQISQRSAYEDSERVNIVTLCNKITKIFFDRLKITMFLKYKQSMAKKELEEIKIYNIKPKESVEVIILKEKYVYFFIFYF